jgi:beta-phosphoglucomutase family hydrolase
VTPGLAFIFDMDGVIIDSNPAHRDAWAAFNRQYGIETTEAMHEKMYGRRNDDILRDFFGPSLAAEEIAARSAAKERLFREMVGGRLEEMLVPGVRQFLEARRGAPMALATNAEAANVEFLLDRAAIRSYFRAVVNGEQVHRPKPHPEIYLRAAELLEADPANCIVFEDSRSGVEAALAAGMRVIGICTTHGHLPGAAINIDNFLSGHLKEWLAGQTRAV